MGCTAAWFEFMSCTLCVLTLHKYTTRLSVSGFRFDSAGNCTSKAASLGKRLCLGAAGGCGEGGGGTGFGGGGRGMEEGCGPLCGDRLVREAWPLPANQPWDGVVVGWDFAQPKMQK